MWNNEINPVEITDHWIMLDVIYTSLTKDLLE